MRRTNKGKKLVTYYELSLSGRPRKVRNYERVPSQLEKFGGLILLGCTMVLSLASMALGKANQTATVQVIAKSEGLVAEETILAGQPSPSPQISETEEVVVENTTKAGQATSSVLLTPEPTVSPTPEGVEVKDESPATPSVGSQSEIIIAYIEKVFGEHADDAFKVLECENRGLNPNAINHNRNGTVDRGIFQLNSAYWGGEENFDYKINIDKAYMIFEGAGKTWKPWSCAHKVGQKNYLGK